MTLQEQYNLIKEGKGAKDVFTKHAKALFPHLIPNHFGFDNTSQILTQRGIISENLWGITTGNTTQPDWFKIFNESQETNVKADEKKPSKEVDEYKDKSYHNQYEAETGDDVIFDQYLRGIQIETCKDENADKSVTDLKKMVLKNLKKDKLYYTKNAAFGVEGIGYTDEAPGLGKTKEVKGKYASSGMEPVKINEGIGMFMDPIGYKKSDPKPQVYTKKFVGISDKIKGDYVYDIFKNGVKVATIDGEGNANAWMNDQMRNVNLQESELRSMLRQIIKEELNLKEIDQIGEEASKMAKIKKVNDEIGKRKKKIKALETLKELEDDSINPGKIKELYGDVKKLEKMKEKLEKKGKKKEKVELVDEITVVSDKTTPEEISSIAATGDTTMNAVKAAVLQAKKTRQPVTVS
jgi:hypothetical protein